MLQAIRNGFKAFLLSIWRFDNCLSVYDALSEEEKRRVFNEMSKISYWKEQLHIAKSSALSPVFEVTQLAFVVNKYLEQKIKT